MRHLLILLVLVAPLVGCAGKELELKEPVAGTYEVLGPVEGRFGGILLFNFIPIAYNQRIWKAYQVALEQKDADALIDVTISDKWYWAGLFNGNVTTVRGTAVKLKAGAKAEAEKAKEKDAPKAKAKKEEDPDDAESPPPKAEEPPQDPNKPKVPKRKN